MPSPGFLKNYGFVGRAPTNKAKPPLKGPCFRGIYWCCLPALHATTFVIQKNCFHMGV